MSVGNALGTTPIPRLILRYSVPTTLTLMVNFLYNLVDQMFIGWDAGVTGMAATNVAFPLIILTNAVALLIGDGCAARMSLMLGKKRPQQAAQALAQAVLMLAVSSVVLGAACFGLAPGIVRLFGSSPNAYHSSLAYMRIIALGLPLQMACPALTAIIRADGRPRYAMVCMLAGALINLALDPIFIFVLHMGVPGAAMATVIGQLASGAACWLYLRRLQTVQLTRAHWRFAPRMCGRILVLGLPSLLTQVLTALVQIVLNNLMTRTGKNTPYGSDMALSCFGMMMKVYQIAHAMFVGVSSATQPIHGYNFGAGHYARVKRTWQLAACIGLGISVVWFGVFQLFGRAIAGLFVPGNALYATCAQQCFRLYMAAFFLYGLYMPTSSFFQGIGKPLKALILPVVRQAVVLIPLALVLAARFGFAGALLAAPVADCAAFALALALALWEFRTWRRSGLLQAASTEG